MKAVALAAVLLVFLTAGAASAPAHVIKKSGPFEVELGWGKEPPRAGAENSVEVGISDARREPVAIAAGALSVEVVYGDSAVTLPLVPTAAPGTLEAPLTPTRPGTYSFHVTGSVDGRLLDVAATCSESSFECVEPATDTEFPVKDPSAGALAQRVSSEAHRIDDTRDRADHARALAIVALVLGALALAISIRAARRRGSDRP